MFQIVPLTSSPNQTIQVSLSVDGSVLPLFLYFNFNETAGYWVMQVSDANRNVLLTNIPLLCGVFPAANILGQYAYLGIGSAYVLNASGIAEDSPDDSSLGTDFVLVWGDTPGAVA